MAAGDINVTVVGNLTNDPELRFTPSGAAVASFTVASSSRYLDKATNEWKDGDPVFMAQDQFSLRYESERYPAIKMVAIKEYHVAKAA